jgi:hypothetical protein
VFDEEEQEHEDQNQSLEEAFNDLLKGKIFEEESIKRKKEEEIATRTETIKKEKDLLMKERNKEKRKNKEKLKKIEMQTDEPQQFIKKRKRLNEDTEGNPSREVRKDKELEAIEKMKLKKAERRRIFETTK